ncbi:hypothetical protein C7N43_26855 [Sphingobacteriales bacterium UPWRP_1]|nr:hypothetical protein B6N25_03610 [Sphingobacteriales bacterium TSM_CSS]PSJ73873.1 hypothetical protein C7N43_26855 [Sphingobacteriales bacterium UPWRP_1]
MSDCLATIRKKCSNSDSTLFLSKKQPQKFIFQTIPIITIIANNNRKLATQYINRKKSQTATIFFRQIAKSVFVQHF